MFSEKNALLSTSEEAERLLSFGFHVFPLKYRAKTPIFAWRKWQTEKPTIDQIKEWFEGEKRNLAIATSNCVVVDADSSDAAKWVEEHLTKTPWRVKTKNGKHFFFRASREPTKNSVNEQLKIDVRGFGGYVVAPPSTHPSGSIYTWEMFDGANHVDDLPELTKQDFKLINSGIGQGKGNLVFDADAIKTSAEAIPTKEGGRNSAAASLCGRYLGEGKSVQEISDLLHTWNQSNPKPLDADEIDGVIQSIVKTHLQRNPMAVVEVVEKPKPEPRTSKPKFPYHLLNVPGLMGQVCDWINESAMHPTPALTMAATIPALGALFGRKFEAEGSTRTNIYTIGIAGTAVGKNHARSSIKALFEHAGADQLIGGEDFASASGLILALAKNPSCYFMVDEFGLFLQSVMHKNAAGHRAEILSTLMQLYSSSCTKFRGREYATKDRMDIDQPNACLYGTTTPSTFFDALTSDRVIDGFLNRILVFHHEGERKRPKRIGHRKPPPSYLIDQIRALSEFKPLGGNLAGTTNDGTTDLDVQFVTTENDARQLWFDFSDLVCDRLNKHSSTSPLWGRAEEHAMKLAMIYAISEDYRRARIDIKAMEWAVQLVKYLIDFSVHSVERYLSDGYYEKEVKRMHRIIEESGGIGRSDLTRKTQHLKMQLRNEILSTLIDSGQVAREKGINGDLYVAR